MDEALRDAPIRILLVDDQTLLRQSFQRLLELESADVEVVGTAADGLEALELIEHLTRAGRAPQVVLMDVRMPRMDGVQATARIHERWPDVRVMMLTTFDDEEYVVEGLHAGARGYLLKDISASDLLTAIRAIHRGDSPLQPSVAAKLVARWSHTTHPLASGGVSAPDRAARPLEGRHTMPYPGEDLTEREREILRSIAHGASNREIGEALFITEGTVKNHVSSILSKLALRDRTQAALWAHEHDLS